VGSPRRRIGASRRPTADHGVAETGRVRLRIAVSASGRLRRAKSAGIATTEIETTGNGTTGIAKATTRTVETTGIAAGATPATAGSSGSDRTAADR